MERRAPAGGDAQPKTSNRTAGQRVIPLDGRPALALEALQQSPSVGEISERHNLDDGTWIELRFTCGPAQAYDFLRSYGEFRRAHGQGLDVLRQLDKETSPPEEP